MQTTKHSNRQPHKNVVPAILIVVLCLPLGLLATPIGANMANPFLMGTYSAGTFSYTDTRNNTASWGYLNDFGQPSDDIYYKFTIQGNAQVNISLCGSGMDTYVHLLDNNGTEIAFNDDNGPLCAGAESSISTNLVPGTYYIVSEGWNTTAGDITTSVNMVVQQPQGFAAQNFVRTWDALSPQTDPNAMMAAPTTAVRQSTQYLDGLGRPLQTVIKDGSLSYNSANPSSPTVQDIVKPYTYNDLLSPRDYLAYPSATNPGDFKPNAVTDQQTFIANKFGENTAVTYGTTQMEDNPLGRPSRSFMPGQSWIGTGTCTKNQYSFNQQSENIQVWSLDYSNTALPVTSPAAVYASGTLGKTITTDEKNLQVISYTDLNGNLILKKAQLNPAAGDAPGTGGWAYTYYVFDDLNQLRYTITPAAVDALPGNGWNMTQQMADGLCYKNLYDGKGRVIAKHKPGAVSDEVFVYDQFDRPVLSQDANQNAQNQWSFVLYDGLNRRQATGLMDFGGAVGQATMQASVNGLPGQTVNVSAFVGNGGYQDVVVESPVYSNSNPLGANSVVFNMVTLFDNYNYNGVKALNANYTLPYAVGTNNAQPLVQSARLLGKPTGEKVRVLDNDNNNSNDKFLSSTVYYDEEGRAVQTLSDNYRLELDISTTQYDWAGRALGSYLAHRAGNAAKQVTMVNRLELDALGRVSRTWKSVNGSLEKQVAEYQYDEFGQLLSKRLGPNHLNGTTGRGEMETLNYEYNIQGWLTYINKGFVNTPLVADQFTTNYFGLRLDYDNKNGQFAAAQYNGNITGEIWKSAGDNVLRKYDYQYDGLDRFTAAVYAQSDKPASTPTWSNAANDFSTYVTYADMNGNIQALKRYSVLPGGTGPTAIDDLTYTYQQNTNKLQAVADAFNGPNNGLMGDFADKAANGSEYNYDANANTITDQNKGASITYNFLDKPASVTIAGKSRTDYFYDASGEKMAQTVTPLNGVGLAKTTVYMGAFVYDDDELSFIQHEEGRIKAITAVGYANNGCAAADRMLGAGTDGVNLPGGKTGVWEYFVKDQHGSTRMVLTEEEQTEKYWAKGEQPGGCPNKQTDEARFFGQVDANGNPSGQNEYNSTLEPKPSFWNSTVEDNGSNVFHLTAADATKKIGPNMLLRVMAGDKVSANVDYFFYSPGNTGGSPGIAGSIAGVLATLLTQTASAPAIISHDGTQAVGALTGSSNADFTNFVTHNNGDPYAPPRAYLNVLFFDEQMRFVAPDPAYANAGQNVGSISISIDINKSNAQDAYLNLAQLAPRNGYAFVYISNESNENVYFDNLAVQQEHGRISEETHYFTFGLKNAAISSRAFGKLQNKYGYQGDYAENDEETDYDEFDLRSYDAQLGRWLQPDPYDEFASGYVGMGNDPVNCVDEDGGFTGWVGALSGFVAGGTAGYLIGKNNGLKGWGLLGATFGGAALGAGLGYAVDMTWFNKAAENGFWTNFRSFYAGIFGKETVTEHSSIGKMFSGYGADACPMGIPVATPDIWGWVGKIKLPHIGFAFLKKPVFEVGEDITLNAIFIANQAKIDFEATDKEELDETIKKIARTLRKNKDKSLSLSGGTDYKGSLKDIVSDPPPQTFEQLVHARVKTVIDYVKKIVKPTKIIKRVFDNGRIIRGNKIVNGKIN